MRSRKKEGVFTKNALFPPNKNAPNNVNQIKSRYQLECIRIAVFWLCLF